MVVSNDANHYVDGKALTNAIITLKYVNEPLNLKLN